MSDNNEGVALNARKGTEILDANDRRRMVVTSALMSAETTGGALLHNDWVTCVTLNTIGLDGNDAALLAEDATRVLSKVSQLMHDGLWTGSPEDLE